MWDSERVVCYSVAVRSCANGFVRAGARVLLRDNDLWFLALCALSRPCMTKRWDPSLMYKVDLLDPWFRWKLGPGSDSGPGDPCPIRPLLRVLRRSQGESRSKTQTQRKVTVQTCILLNVLTCILYAHFRGPTRASCYKMAYVSYNNNKHKDNNNNRTMFPIFFLIGAGLAIPRLFLASSFFFEFNDGPAFWSHQIRVRHIHHALGMLGGGGGSRVVGVKEEDVFASPYLCSILR